MAVTDTYNSKSAIVDYMVVTEWKNGEDYTVSIDAGDQNVPFDITTEEPDLIY